MLGGTVTKVFEEPDLRTAEPGCIAAVAAAHVAGYRLAPRPNVNHEDVLIGPTRLQQAKDMKPRQFRREIRWHYLPRAVKLFGEDIATPPLAFFARWQADAILRANIERLPDYERILNQIRAQYRRERQTILAAEGNRFVYGKIGGDPATLRDFANMMEGGVGR